MDKGILFEINNLLIMRENNKTVSRLSFLNLADIISDLQAFRSLKMPMGGQRHVQTHIRHIPTHFSVVRIPCGNDYKRRCELTSRSVEASQILLRRRRCVDPQTLRSALFTRLNYFNVIFSVYTIRLLSGYVVLYAILIS